MTYARTAAWIRPRLWMGAAGLVPWVVWIGSLAIGGWYKDFEGTLIGADHLAFYTAAHLIRDGQQERIYDYLNLHSYEQGLIGWDWGGFEGYRNPPFYALLFLPTAGLSYYVSMLIWTAVGFALLALAISLLRPARPGAVFLWSLTFYPVFATISFGQNTFLSLAVFAGVYRLLVANRPLSAGLTAGLLWFKPQLLLGLFLWWAFSPRRYFRCWVGVAATGAILATLSWTVLPQASIAFVRNLGTIVSYHGFGLWNVDNPKVFFELLVRDLAPFNQQLSLGGFQFSLRAVFAYSLAIAVSVVSIAGAWRLNQRSRSAIGTMFPVAVFLSLWASPHALIYEWAILAAAGVVLWERFPGRRDAWLCLFVLTWIALMVCTPLAFVQIQHLHWRCVVQVSVPLLGLVGWLFSRELQDARPNDELC
jgi:hypothetical protein